MDFRLKKITFFHRELVIICQNENGPCPLIAIANVLLLRGDMAFSSDLAIISLDSLVEQVGNQVFSFFEKSSHRLSPENMTAILNVLPNLAHGLDVNVSFNGVDKMEYTEQIALFDALNVPLLHGWVFDPFDRELAETIGNLTYNHMVYMLVEYRSLVDKIQNRLRHSSQDEISSTLNEKDRKLLRDGRIFDRFMKQTASQLTEQGLLKLHDFLQDRQLFVFFRNNHFSTMFYYQNQLFVLVTDLGYQDQPHVIWELLESVSGSGAEFYNSDFVPLRDLPLSVINSSPGPSTVVSSPAPPHTIAVGHVVTPAAIISSHTPMSMHGYGEDSDETQNPMLPGGGRVTYDPDYEMAMRLHLQESNNHVSSHQSNTISVDQVSLSQLQQHQQQQHAIQQQYFQQSQLQQQRLQQQELHNLQQRSPAVMLKGVPVEPGYVGGNYATPPPPAPQETDDSEDEENDDDDIDPKYKSNNIVSPDLGMTQEELDRNTAMMLQFEDDQKAAKDRRRYEKRIRLRNRFLGLDESTGLEDAGYGGEKSNCVIM